MKKLFCASLIIMSLVFSSAHVPTFTNAQTVTDFKGKKAEVFTSSEAQESEIGTKSSVSVSFIEDPNNSDLIALVSVKGFIPSGLNKTGGNEIGTMFWPSKYGVIIESRDPKNDVKILESIPSNKVETVRVTETMGYSIGGSISATKDGGATANSNTNFSVSRSVAYDQQDYKTTQRSDNLQRASWDIEFNATRDGYDRNSYHFIYGNQLFMKSRLSNTGDQNFTDNKDLSALIVGGFSPNMVVALKAPKGTEKSQLTVRLDRYIDRYRINWAFTQWVGNNIGATHPEATSHTYELDWKNRTIRKA